MELISPRPLTGEQELKQELFLRVEELERLVAIYKLKLCGEEMASLNYGSKLMQQSNKDVLDDQRGQFYDIYMRKREEKLREEWRARGAEKEAEMRAMMETLHSTSSSLMKKGKTMEPMYAHSSTSRISAATARNPAIRSSKTASLRNENLKSSTGISNETCLQWSVAQSQSSNDKFSLVNDIKARRSQSLRKNCVSLGEPKDFIHLNYNPDTSSQLMNTNPQRSGAQRPLHGKSMGTTPTAGISKAKSSNSQFQVVDYTDLLKENNEQVDSTRNDENGKLRLSKESWNSAYHRFGSRSQFVASPKSSNSQIQNVLPDLHEASDFDSSVDSQRLDPAKDDLHKMNQCLEGKTVRVRKKWGSLERPFVAVDASTHPIMDVTKGIKRFLKFGKRSGSSKDDNHDSENYIFRVREIRG